MMETCVCRSYGQQIRIALVTLSDTRTLETDNSGDKIEQLIGDSGNLLARRDLIKDEPQPLRTLIAQIAQNPQIDAIVTTGGTGIAPRDQTIDVVRQLLDAELPGFGEHFRRLSMDEIGPQAMLSRAIAGRIGSTLIFCLPGSTGAVTTGMTQCVLPILPHAVGLMQPADASS